MYEANIGCEYQKYYRSKQRVGYKTRGAPAYSIVCET